MYIEGESPRVQNIHSDPGGFLSYNKEKYGYYEIKRRIRENAGI